MRFFRLTVGRMPPFCAVLLLACGGTMSSEHIERDEVTDDIEDAAAGGSAGAVSPGGGEGGPDTGATGAAGGMANAVWDAGAGGDVPGPDGGAGGLSDPCTNAVEGAACGNEGATCDRACNHYICELGIWQQVPTLIPC